MTTTKLKPTKCDRHHRLLSYAEALAGACSHCRPELFESLWKGSPQFEEMPMPAPQERLWEPEAEDE